MGHMKFNNHKFRSPFCIIISHRHIVSELNEYSMLRESRYYAVKSIKVLNYYIIDTVLKYINEYIMLRELRYYVIKVLKY